MSASRLLASVTRFIQHTYKTGLAFLAGFLLRNSFDLRSPHDLNRCREALLGLNSAPPRLLCSFVDKSFRVLKSHTKLIVVQSVACRAHRRSIRRQP